MREFYIETQSFAAPFVSDHGSRYVKAESAAKALEICAAQYKHPAGLYSAAAYSSADAMNKGEKPLATWLCNHEIAKAELTDGLGVYSYMSIAPGKFEINGDIHFIADPKGGRVVGANP
jgi:hypothetical protein